MQHGRDRREHGHREQGSGDACGSRKRLAAG
jgi:hypothetical protein